MILEEIKSPTLLLDKQKVIRNIKFMFDKAKMHNLIFRPHFKTHQSAEIGEWFRSFGVDKITVSSVGMAEYFALKGWKDITIAFPLNIRELADIEMLASKVKLNILLSSLDAMQFLSDNLKQKLGFLIKIDTGYHRAGINPQDTKYIQQIIDAAAKNSKLHFSGFLAHFGHTYHAENKQEVFNIFESGRKQLSLLKDYFSVKFPDLIISIGDTPSCTLIEDFTSIDEIRPGNFVFYDLMQESIEVCSKSDIAVVLACPVIDTYPERGEILIYGGSVHLSKEYIIDKKNGYRVFGKIALLSENTWIETDDSIYVKSLSQEHGIIHASKSFIESVKIGDLLAVLPVHSCLTANLMKSYQAIGGEEIAMWDGH